MRHVCDIYAAAIDPVTGRQSDSCVYLRVVLPSVDQRN